ncbi:TolB family protein [Myxococcota bacterium]
MRGRRIPAWLTFIPALAMMMIGACEEDPASGNYNDAGAGDGALQDVGLDVMVQNDASPDASVVDARVYPDCDVPILQPEEIVPGELIRLPPTGQNEMYAMDWDGRYVAYAEHRCSGWGSDIFVFDLDTMQESIVAARVGGQKSPSVWASGILFFDGYYTHFPSPENDLRIELYHFDVPTGQETRLTDGNWPKILPVYNGTHVAYLSGEWDPPSFLYDFVLREVSTGQEQTLADHNQGVQQCYGISEEYVTWQALSPSQPNTWDIFYHHIPTGITDRLYLDTPYLLCPAVAGQRLAWNEMRNGNWDVFVMDLETSIEEQITDDPADQVMIRGLGGNFLVWQDYRHSGGTFPGYATDFYFHELSTGISRRLTLEAREWGIHKPVSCQWLMRVQVYGEHQGVIYAWDLVTAGVLDQNCHLIPCDPETEICSVMEWQGP